MSDSVSFRHFSVCRIDAICLGDVGLLRLKYFELLYFYDQYRGRASRRMIGVYYKLCQTISSEKKRCPARWHERCFVGFVLATQQDWIVF